MSGKLVSSVFWLDLTNPFEPLMWWSFKCPFVVVMVGETHITNHPPCHFCPSHTFCVGVLPAPPNVTHLVKREGFLLQLTSWVKREGFSKPQPYCRVTQVESVNDLFTPPRPPPCHIHVDKSFLRASNANRN